MVASERALQSLKNNNLLSMLSRQGSLAPPKIFKAYRQESPEFQEAVALWENNETDTISYTDEEGQLVHCPGTIGGGQFAGKPAFQAFNLKKTFTDGGTLVAESVNCISFIPAGFRGGPTPNTMNPCLLYTSDAADE